MKKYVYMFPEGNGKMRELLGGIVTNVEYGQEWKIKKEDISDWMYTRGDKIYGGYTIVPLLVTYPKEEADELRAKLVR